MEIELKQYVALVQKKLWFIASLVLLASVAAGFVSYYVVTPRYEASSKLIVNKSIETQGRDDINFDSLRTNAMLVKTYKEIIQTPAILDQVVVKYPELGLTAKDLLDMIRVSSTIDTQVMTISITSLSYEKAAKTVNAVSEVFKSTIPSIMKVDNVVILNEAKPDESVKPVSPNVKINVAIVFVISFMLALGFVFLQDYLDDSIKSERDIELFLGLPTLATISMVRPDELIGKTAAKSTRMVGDTVYANANQ
ncbi:YveK family protein [Paenibacillus roseipurpureus]|uniref:Wzz/FepE/Etk N-terminal domain-containing protein n=1 Tax=Paenibacillus roseopurpureus TaxID=2918901 RepID=A0AA96RHZ3_9BACL|nr:Wzz/FepE/Etk N-terminal domain-containing protein [Paenibacillus sp. MBLB1832]WNR43773.1 Wzz/FepE/Etk N-terminal domain-containing protein [Paenibacillus sp. MBLB1832]